MSSWWRASLPDADRRVRPHGPRTAHRAGRPGRRGIRRAVRPPRRPPPDARCSAPLAAAFSAHSATARSFTSTAHTRAPGARRASETAMGPYPQPRSSTSPMASDGWGASCSSRRVPGSTPPVAKTPRSVVSESSRSGNDSETALRSDAAVGWRAKYWEEGPVTVRRYPWVVAPHAIRIIGDPVLKQKAADVTKVDGALRQARRRHVRHHVRRSRRRSRRPAGGRAAAVLRLRLRRPPRRASSTPRSSRAEASSPSSRAACRCPA